MPETPQAYNSLMFLGGTWYMGPGGWEQSQISSGVERIRGPHPGLGNLGKSKLSSQKGLNGWLSWASECRLHCSRKHHEPRPGSQAGW